MPFAQPDDLVGPEVVGKHRLDLPAGQVRVSVLVEEALLGRDQRPLSVDEERAALENHRRDVAAHSQLSRNQLGHARVERGRLRRVAPPVEAEVHHGELPCGVADEDRPVVTHPRIVELGFEQLDPRRQQPTGLTELLAPHEHEHRLELGDDVGDGRLLPLRLTEALGAEVTVGPEIRPDPAWPRHQGQLVRLPLRRHREPVGARASRFGGRQLLGSLRGVVRHWGSSTATSSTTSAARSGDSRLERRRRRRSRAPRHRERLRRQARRSLVGIAEGQSGTLWPIRNPVADQEPCGRSGTLWPMSMCSWNSIPVSIDRRTGQLAAIFSRRSSWASVRSPERVIETSNRRGLEWLS